MKRHWKRILTAAIVLIIAALIFTRINAGKQQAQSFQKGAPLVKIEKPLRELVTYQLQYTGDVSAIQQAHIFSKVGGNLERIFADMGMAVRKNQLLAVIDSTELYQQTLQTAALFYNARQNYERVKQLLDQDLLSKEELDNAHTALKIAQANYELAKTRLSYARITAPFSGYITKRFLDVGALISPNNATLFTLMDIETVKIVINVLEKDSQLIPQLKKALIVADALPQRQFEGVIVRHNQAIDLSTRTMSVEINVPNSDHLLKPGMFVTATLIVAEHADAITVPTTALLKDAKGLYVFAVEGSAAKRLPVQIGVEQNTRTEILGGLSGNEDIITTGQQFVRDGGPVSVQKNLAN